MSRVFPRGSTALDPPSTHPGQRGAPHAGFKVGRSRAKVWPKELATCELWLNQVANPGAIAYGTRYRAKVRILLGPW